MPGSVQEGRVTKDRAIPSARRKSSRARVQKNKNKEAKPLPLVERVNKLSCDEFISLYIPPQDREHASTLSSQDESVSVKYTLDIYTAKTILPADFEACFKLIEQTQSETYASSSFGWSPSKKRKEMRLPDMKYMILRQASGDKHPHDPGRDTSSDPADFQGFLSFMVTYEDGQEVIYCYEIHLLPSAQGRGLGEMLMTKFAEVGRRVGVQKAMLTVFKSNTKANRLYKKLGYELDEYSPRPRTLRNGTVVDVDYWIMSRKLQSGDSEDN